MTGWDLTRVILAMAGFTVVYTVGGGMQAVVWTSVVQGCIFIAAAWPKLVAPPVPDYVRPFTKDVPRVKVLTARTVMQPIRPKEQMIGRAIAIDEDHAGRSTRERLEADAARPGADVEEAAARDARRQDVEERLLDAIPRRPRGVALRRPQPPSLPHATNDPH